MVHLFCDYCGKMADDFDVIAGTFKPTKLPSGHIKRTCTRCVELIIEDHYRRKEEMVPFDIHGDLIAG